MIERAELWTFHKDGSVQCWDIKEGHPVAYCEYETLAAAPLATPPGHTPLERYRYYIRFYFR